LEKNPPACLGSKDSQQNPGRRVLFGKSWKKIQHDQNPIFKPAISSGFQIAGHRKKGPRSVLAVEPGFYRKKCAHLRRPSYVFTLVL